MCGRVCCALCPETYREASSYYDKKTSRYVKPNWRDEMKGNMGFQPSVNLAPTSITPVLLSGDHFDDETKFVMMPMLWRMIPRWHKGLPNAHGLSTSNARLEGLSASKMYGPCLKRGQRAVAVCEGFYEWKAVPGKGKPKQPHMFYAPQREGVRVEEANNWAQGEWSDSAGWNGPSLLKMAAVYDTWLSEEGEQIYSYSIITMESNDTMSWCHERMPAILSTNEDIENWLDFENVGMDEALKILVPAPSLSHHPVDPLINKVKNHDAHLNRPYKKPIELETGSASFMSKWLKGGFGALKRNPEPGSSDLLSKKIKKEDNGTDSFSSECTTPLTSIKKEPFPVKEPEIMREVP